MRSAARTDQISTGEAGSKTVGDFQGSSYAALILIDCGALLPPRVAGRARSLLALGDYRLALELMATQLGSGTDPIPTATCDILRHLPQLTDLDPALAARLRARSAQGPRPDHDTPPSPPGVDMVSSGFIPPLVVMGALEKRGYGVSSAGWADDHGEVILQLALYNQAGHQPRIRSIDGYPIRYTTGPRFVAF